MKKLKILWILYIIITLGLLLIATNSNIIVEQRVCILIATYVIGTIAGLFGAFIGFLEIDEEEQYDKRTRSNRSFK